MAEGGARTRYAALQTSDEGLAVGLRLRIALDVLEALAEDSVELAPRAAKSRLLFSAVCVDEEGRSSVEGDGDASGAAQLAWEIVAGRAIRWSGSSTDDELPEDVPGPVIDVLGTALGEQGKAGDLAEKLEDASRGFADTHDDVRSAVAAWIEENGPPHVSVPPKAAAVPAKPAAAPVAAPPPQAAKPVEAKPQPAKIVEAKAEPAKVVEAKPVAAPAAPIETRPEPKPEPTPEPKKAETKVMVSPLVSQLPESGWSMAPEPAPMSTRLDDALAGAELPPPESVAPPAPNSHAESDTAPAYPEVPPAPRVASFPDPAEVTAQRAAAAEAAKPKAPQPKAQPEPRAVRSFIETVPPEGDDEAPASHALIAQPVAVAKSPAEAAPVARAPAARVEAQAKVPGRVVPPAPTAPRPPMRTEPLGAGIAAPPPPRDIKRPEVAKPTLPQRNGASPPAPNVAPNDLASPPRPLGQVPPVPKIAPPRQGSSPDVMPPDFASAATEGAIPLPQQPPAPAMPAQKVIVVGAEPSPRSTDGSGRRQQPTIPSLPRPAAPALSLPPISLPPPRRNWATIIVVVVVAALGIGLFAFLASQMHGPPETTPLREGVTAAPTATEAAPPTAEPAPPPSATAAERPAPTAAAAPTTTATTAVAPTPTTQPQGRPARSSGTPKKRPQQVLPDRL